MLAAVALQDHIARTMRIPGGPKKLPSMEPGADLTLAQHLGLIPRPPPLLTEAEWDEVHLKARLRQDYAQQCPICREEFKNDPQVLLSCTHVFHRACLASYERFALCRACPLCRSQKYQRKVIDDGAQAYRHTCATRIQAAVRSWLARRRYKEYCKKHAPKDPRLRRIWAAERLKEENDKLLAYAEEHDDDIDALFAELDANLAISRKVCEEISRPIARRLRSELEASEALHATLESTSSTWTVQEDRRPNHPPLPTMYPVPTTISGEDGGRDSYLRTSSPLHQLVQSASSSARVSHVMSRSSLLVTAVATAASPTANAWACEVVDWHAVVTKAKERGERDCPICIGALGRRGKMGVAWLSCTHCFHLDCIMAFEAFELSHGGSPSCPVCRAAYQRRCFSD
ncbi:hypothetical protein CEUSTIGMA_g6665.t1 [Chlamydomonas eustigma]|uniref:RING-type domain-containing protein n=1 Tax=Chlamydomonas eustigma TaxID=1157962 RepID=A0A250X828_9CHLO|nr:hypothetical protein CEUSTIGMA_g6665.t1 [Chlamydomonas eustigma]|eukprot:GAX79225.1 hypothetical protein CEUSTIGMA_g6665.t1 [Chlamydomonas eustigma]